MIYTENTLFDSVSKDINTNKNNQYFTQYETVLHYSVNDFNGSCC
jgi:hypothetical protein